MPPRKCAISLETAFTQGGTFTSAWKLRSYMGLQYNKSEPSFRQASSRLASGGVYPTTRVDPRCALMSVVEGGYARHFQWSERCKRRRPSKQSTSRARPRASTQRNVLDLHANQSYCVAMVL